MTRRSSTAERETGYQFAADGSDHGRLEIRCDHDRRMAVRVPQVGSSFSPDTSRHTSSDISYVGRTLAEIDVIDGSQAVGETFGDGDDGVVRGGARGDLGQGRFDDPGVPGEQGLRDEDRPDVLSG